MSVKLPRPPRAADLEEVLTYCEDIERQLNLVGSRTIDVGSISAGTVTTFTITVTGCKVDEGQQVALGAPSGLDASLMWCGTVTADNTVTVRVYNPTGGAIDPASGIWSARVLL